MLDKSIWSRKAALLLSSSALAILTPVAHSQTSELTSSVSSTAPEAEEFSETEARQKTIVVTAQKRAESILEVPASLSALDENMLEARGINDVANLQFAVPSLTMGRSLGVSQLSIRGVGRSVGAPGVSVNIDGVYQPRDTPMISAKSDLERIEVLRGPQGTLYGRNANAGAINFITKAPSNERSVEVLAGLAEYDEYQLQMVANLPISDRVKTRFVVNLTDRNEGFVKNVAGGQDLDAHKTLSGRFRLAAELSENLSLDVNVSAFNRTGPTDYYVLNAPPLPDAIAKNPFLGTANVPLEPWKTSALGKTASDREFHSVSATLNWTLPFGVLKSITAYQSTDGSFDMDRDGFDVRAIETIRTESTESFSQELALSASLGSVDLVTGLFYFTDRAESVAYYEFPFGFAPLPTNNFLMQAKPQDDIDSYAAFADATWHISDKVKLIGGLRYSEDNITMVHENSIGPITIGAPTPSLLTCPAQLDDMTFDDITFRVGAQYHVDQHQNVYLTASNGFKAGGVNYTSCNNTFEPEYITAFEGGYKGSLLNGALNISAAAFYYDYTDFQLSQVVGITSRITNAASAEVKGAELESSWDVNEAWSVNGSLTLLDSTYGDFTNVDSLNPAAGVQDIGGRTLNNSPKVSGNFGVAYTTRFSNDSRLEVRADASARSRLYFREFNAKEDSQEGYAVFSANAIWTSPDDSLSLRAYMANIGDQDYQVAMLAVDGLGGRMVSYGAPRQAGIEIRKRF